MSSTPSDLRQNIRKQRLAALMESTKKATSFQSSNSSLNEKVEAEEIAPRLTTLLDKSMADLDAALESFGLEKEDSIQPRTPTFVSDNDIKRPTKFDSSVKSPAKSRRDKKMHALGPVSESSDSIPPTTKAPIGDGKRPTNDNSVVKFPAARSGRDKMCLLGIWIFGFLLLIGPFVYFVLNASSSLSTSSRSLPNGSLVSSPEIADSLSSPSNDQLHDAFKALVGDDNILLKRGSSQNLAAYWITKIDPLRHGLSLQRLEQRFVLACLYFITTNNYKDLWKSCNPELHFSGKSAVYFSIPSDSEASSSCPLHKPLFGTQGKRNEYETIDSMRWLSGQSECGWAGITCQQHPTSSVGSGKFDSVVAIELRGQGQMIKYEEYLNEVVLRLPNLQSISY